jgi:hypothetical protein
MRYILALALLWPWSAQAGWFSYDNYEDCMLGRMKGQSASMEPNADKLCKKEFKVEFSLPTVDIKWNFTTSGGSTLITIEDAADFEILSGTFAFSEDPCSKLTKIFTPANTLPFVGKTALYTASAGTMHCANLLDLRGRYK